MDRFIMVSIEGEKPCLCAAHVKVVIDYTDQWDFGTNALISGGQCYVDDDTGEPVITRGRWTVREWPHGFPEDKELRKEVTRAINEQVKFGCCGGCL